MVFSSVIFLLYFLPLFLGLYFLADRRYKNTLVLLASILFYSWGAPKFVFLLLASTYLDFYLVRWMHYCLDTGRKRALLALSISLNVGLLAYFKYANFFVDNLNALFQSLGASPVPWAEVALPIGISFYTFQTLTYSIDVYRKQHAPLERVSDYMLYIIMFPQLIAGPIVRFGHIADQITQRITTNDDRLIGFYRFCIGLGKKVLVANTLGATANRIMGMEDFSALDTPTAWLGLLAYTFQIYFDFSGYSDMAIGLGRMMGFRFPENFNSPYTSRSISEFWRRWHITLGAWMRDYLYIPLGGNQVSSASRLYFNLWFVFLVSGLWHGASWNFVAWGAYHGFFLIAERLFLRRFLKRIGPWGSWAYCFVASVLGWVIFRIEDIGLATQYYGRLFAFDWGSGVDMDARFWATLPVATFFSFFVLSPYGKKIHDAVFHQGYSLRAHLIMWPIAMILFTLSVAALSTAGFNPFIYFRF
jgi:alginate O-acetyltransferase complex protein AlgI